MLDMYALISYAMALLYKKKKKRLFVNMLIYIAACISMAVGSLIIGRFWIGTL